MDETRELTESQDVALLGILDDLVVTALANHPCDGGFRQRIVRDAARRMVRFLESISPEPTRERPVVIRPEVLAELIYRGAPREEPRAPDPIERRFENALHSIIWMTNGGDGREQLTAIHDYAVRTLGQFYEPDRGAPREERAPDGWARPESVEALRTGNNPHTKLYVFRTLTEFFTTPVFFGIGGASPPPATECWCGAIDGEICVCRGVEAHEQEARSGALGCLSEEDLRVRLAAALVPRDGDLPAGSLRQGAPPSQTLRAPEDTGLIYSGDNPELLDRLSKLGGRGASPPPTPSGELLREFYDAYMAIGVGPTTGITEESKRFTNALLACRAALTEGIDAPKKLG